MGRPVTNRLIFIHVPKTAGSSFSRIIQANEQHVYVFRGLRKLYQDVLPTTCVIQGHMHHGVHRFLKGRVQYFTFLRNPIEQAISYYYFSRSWEGQYDYHDAITYDLADFYRHRRHQNMQTNYIGGYMPRRLTRFLPGSVLLSNAKRRLRSNVHFGIVEAYQESVSRLCDEFGWSNMPIVHVRQARGRPDTSDVPTSVLKSLRQSNRLDMALYEYARQRFEREI